jgi:hypothetical protein
MDADAPGRLLKSKVVAGKSKGCTQNQKAKGKGQKAKGRHFIFLLIFLW